MKNQILFLEKIRKIYFKMSSAEFFSQHAVKGTSYTWLDFLPGFTKGDSFYDLMFAFFCTPVGLRSERHTGECFSKTIFFLSFERLQSRLM